MVCVYPYHGVQALCLSLGYIFMVCLGLAEVKSDKGVEDTTPAMYNLYLYLYKSAKLTMDLRGYNYYLDQPTRYHHTRLLANVPPSNSS